MDHSVLGSVTHAVATALAARGYRQCDGSLVLRTDNGDAVVVGFQESGFTTRDTIAFYINIALVPLPWLGWLHREIDKTTLRQQIPKDADAIVEERLVPENVFEVWQASSQAEATQLANEIVAGLGNLLPRFETLLDRDEFLGQLREPQTLRGLNPTKRVAELILLLDQPEDGHLGERQQDLMERASGGDRQAIELGQWAQAYRAQLET